MLYDVMKNEGAKTPALSTTSLKRARVVKAQLRKAGNDAFILKVWNEYGRLFEDVVR